MYYYKALIYKIFIFLPTLLCAQTFNNTNYTVDNGLPSSEVYHVVQDKTGFIWFATDEGVSRFDGYLFKNFTNLEGLPDNTVLEIYEDYKSRIWFISISGRLSWFENDSIHTFPYNNLIENRLSGSNFPVKKSFYIDSLDNIYISFYNYNILKISQNGIITEISPKNNNDLVKIVNEKSLLYTSKYRSNKITVETKKKDKTVYTLKHKRNKRTRTFAHKFQDYIVYSDFYSLYVLDSLGNSHYKKFNNDVLWISTGKDSLLWVGLLNEGVYAYKNLNFKKEVFHLAKSSSVSSVSYDHEDGFWVTTLENGVFYYPSLKIRHITEESGINSNKISQLSKKDNKIYFGGYNLHYYSFDLEKLKEYKFKADRNLLDCKELEWIGDSLFISNSLGGSRIIYDNKIVYHNYRMFRKILKVADDNLLFFHGNRVRNFKGDYISIKNVANIYDVLELNNNTILLGTDIGLFNYNWKTKHYVKVNKYPVLNNRINVLFKDKEDIWIGTKGAGVLKFTQDTIYRFSIKDGLPGNSITSIIKSDSLFFFGTNNGIAQVQFNDSSRINDITIYNSGHGLITNSVKDIGILKNKLFVATHKGLSYLNKNLESKESDIYITDFNVTSKDTLLKNHYELEHNQNFIEVSFVSLNYKRNTPIQYLYKLEGVDKRWHKTDDVTVRYALLPPGNYKFIVKCINSYGKHSKNPATLSFTINKAFYQTLLFKLGAIFIIILIASSIILTIFRIKISEIRKRNSLGTELNKYRQKALSAQMNPHFIYNSLNSIQNYILKNDIVKSSEYLSKFGKLMRRVLHNSQNSAISLKEEFEALGLYVDLELARFKNCFNYQLIVKDNINLEKIKVPPLIIQPFVENAIHHGLRLKEGDKNLMIKVFRKTDKICIHIEDNGVGFESSKRMNKNNENKSYGTQITNKRLNMYSNLYKNDIHVKIIDLNSVNNNLTGTRIEIEFIGKENTN